MPPTTPDPINRPAPRTVATTAAVAAPDTDGPFDQLRDRWFRALRNAKRSEETIESYKKITDGFYSFLDKNGLPTDPEHITREHVELYFQSLRTQAKPVRTATSAIRFRSLHAGFHSLTFAT
jgi:site-specific recombinase XerD